MDENSIGEALLRYTLDKSSLPEPGEGSGDFCQLLRRHQAGRYSALMKLGRIKQDVSKVELFQNNYFVLYICSFFYWAENFVQDSK